MSDTAIIPAGTTLIDVYLKNPNGWPLTNTRFVIKPVRASYWDGLTGVVEDKEELYCTDDNGYVQMHLWPLPYPYILTYSYDDDAVPGHFLFYVPEIATPVDFQDLIVTQANEQDKYGEYILAQIVAAKAEVSALVDEAKVLEADTEAYANSAKNSATEASGNAQQTSEDRQQVALTQAALQNVLNSIMEAVVKIQGINLQNKLLLGGYVLWVDATGKLRIKNGQPTSDTDGTVVGTQTN